MLDLVSSSNFSPALTIMSSHRLFSIVGDANVRRNKTGLNLASSHQLRFDVIVDGFSAGGEG